MDGHPSLMSVVKTPIIRARSARQNFGLSYFYQSGGALAPMFTVDKVWVCSIYVYCTSRRTLLQWKIAECSLPTFTQFYEEKGNIILQA